jgi:hypothetical protein
MAEKDWFRDIIAAEKQASTAKPRSQGYSYAADKYGTPRNQMDGPRLGIPKALTYDDWKSRALAEKNAANPVSSSAMGNAGDTGERARNARMESQIASQTQLDNPNAGPSGGGGSRGSGLDKVFAPLFAALDQQRANANSRYTENSGQITNIYGQLIGARTDDVDSINTAYERLQTAAASRGAETLSGMSDRESSRVSQNQAVLGSMGVGDLGTAGNDVASEGAQAAQNTEAANQSNYSGMLDMMNATSQDIARADATSFGYRQGEDIARLQGSREDFLQGVDQQDFNLQSQQIQAEQAYQQAQAAAAASAAASAAAAAQKATSAAQTAAADRTAKLLASSDPLTQAISRGFELGTLDQTGVSNVQGAYNDWMTTSGVMLNPASSREWNKATAVADALKTSGAQLTQAEKSALMEAIANSF